MSVPTDETSRQPVAGSGDGPGDGPGDAALAPVVNRLRDEVDGLRAAMRSRAIIEQAKGMIMERYGCTPDEAFDRLARLSQHANVKLADVASALVESCVATGTTDADRLAVPGRPRAGGPGAVAGGPAGRRQPMARTATSGQPSPATVARARRVDLDQRAWPREGSPDSEFGTRLRATARRTRLRAGLLAARTGQDVLDAVVSAGLAERPPTAAVLATIAVGGLVEVVGTHGVTPAVARRWRSVPIELELLACSAARTGRSAWLTSDAASERRGEQLGLGLPQRWTSAALLPLHSGSTCLGLLGLTWAAPASPAAWDDDQRTSLARLAAAVAVAVQRLECGHGPAGAVPSAVVTTNGIAEAAVLDILLEPVLVCEPVVHDDQVVDLRIVHVNPAATALERIAGSGGLGRSFLELYPESTGNGVFDACLDVLAAGTQIDLTRVGWGVQPGQGKRPGAGKELGFRKELFDVRIARHRHGVLIAWIPTSRTTPTTDDPTIQ